MTKKKNTDYTPCKENKQYWFKFESMNKRWRPLTIFYKYNCVSVTFLSVRKWL